MVKHFMYCETSNNELLPNTNTWRDFYTSHFSATASRLLSCNHATNTSSLSTIFAGNRNATAPPPSNQPAVKEQDRFTPIANMIRIMCRVLPAHAKIADVANFITSEANERCKREQRKTVTPEDMLWAMNKLGVDDYIETLTLLLHRYRELEGDHCSSIRGEPLQLIKHRSTPASCHP
ncbi:hypothetical protein Cni_G17986 [Canna indica]|uniref:Transcription factor CBF/NF-Y/archaeal histone domain-containing protein n=1 Tax=Canna indica TaxID=4628 RepID=A0AAQ3KLE6_9LILI|nr:hypothetical protein Cni_G17986 [Canna indica]